MMSEKPSLEHLRIDRSGPNGDGSVRPLVWVLAILLLLGGTGGAAWYFWPRPGIPVKTATAQAEGGSAGVTGLDATGYVVARRMATLSSKIQGEMAEMNVEEGQQVQEGAVVARLDDSNYVAALRQTRAQEGAAKVALDDEEAIFTRYQRLKDQNAISTDAFENQRALYDADRAALDVAEAAAAFAQTNEKDTIVRAPFTGMVTDKEAQVGEIVAPAAAGGGQTRTGIATLVDMDSLEVEVDVSENYIDRVHAGEQATVVLDAYPDWNIPASVIAVIPTADQTKGTVRVRIGLKTRDHRILPEMGARVSLLSNPDASQTPISHGVTIPQVALQGTGKNASVFLVKDDGTIEMRAVTPGAKSGQKIAIRAGLEFGDHVAIDNFEKLHDGVKVKIVE
jgi:HlyD family secretion protein